MLPSYNRSSSSGAGMTELEPLQHSNSTTSSTSAGAVIQASQFPYRLVRDLLFSGLFFVVGWKGPKFGFLPSEEFLRERVIPYQKLSSGDVVLDLSLNFPLVNPPTVPSMYLIVSSIWVPMILMIVFGFVLRQRSSSLMPFVKTVLTGISSLLLGVGGSEGTTQLLKLWVLRRRPNFYHLCEFNSSSLACGADYAELLESQVSFPSGHSSLSWCGMVVLVWFLLNLQNTGGKLWTFLCIVLPLGFGTFVACSRIVDHWHHVSDVLTGICLGCLWGTIGYRVHHGMTPSSSCLCTLQGLSATPPTKLPSFAV